MCPTSTPLTLCSFAIHSKSSNGRPALANAWALAKAGHAHSLPLLKSVGSLTLFDLHKFHLLKLIHRFINNKLPALFSQFFISSSRTRPPSLRLGPQAPILPYRSQKLLDSYLHTGPMLFNALSRDLRSAPLHKFLFIIKKGFLQNYL